MKFVKLDVDAYGETREVWVPVDRIISIEPGDYEQAEPFMVFVQGRSAPYACLGHHWDDLLAGLDS